MSDSKPDFTPNRFIDTNQKDLTTTLVEKFLPDFPGVSIKNEYVIDGTEVMLFTWVEILRTLEDGSISNELICIQNLGNLARARGAYGDILSKFYSGLTPGFKGVSSLIMLGEGAGFGSTVLSDGKKVNAAFKPVKGNGRVVIMSHEKSIGVTNALLPLVKMITRQFDATFSYQDSNSEEVLLQATSSLLDIPIPKEG